MSAGIKFAIFVLIVAVAGLVFREQIGEAWTSYRERREAAAAGAESPAATEDQPERPPREATSRLEEAGQTSELSREVSRGGGGRASGVSAGERTRGAVERAGRARE